MRSDSTRRGFTVIEALAAGMLMAIFGAAIAVAVGQATAVARQAEDQRLAAQWLDEVLTRIDIIGPARMSLEGPFSGRLDDRSSWTATFEPDAVHFDLYAVNVAVTYRSGPGGDTRTVRGYTLIQDPPGARTTPVFWDDL